MARARTDKRDMPREGGSDEGANGETNGSVTDLDGAGQRVQAERFVDKTMVYGKWYKTKDIL